MPPQPTSFVAGATSAPPVAHPRRRNAATSVPAPAASAPANERVPIQFIFTLFLIEAQLTGDWRHLLIPYAAALLNVTICTCPIHMRTLLFPKSSISGHPSPSVTKSRWVKTSPFTLPSLLSTSCAREAARRSIEHRAAIEEFCENLAKLGVADDVSDIEEFCENLAKLGVADDKERRESTLTDILGRIRTAQTSLDLVYELYATNSDHDSTRLALDAAAETVVAAGKLLRSVKASKNDEELAKLWNDVHAEAVALDKLVDCVGAIIPKADVEVNEVEVEYDTEHHFEDPIGDHDTVAQIVILFAIISNVVIGLATNPCNFLIDAVTLIIKLTMSLSSSPGAEYTAKQRDVLSQLPTTLEDALKTFKLEPKTRILATCPSCHYTHEPQPCRPVLATFA
ncbi:hypothetical protein C8R44DRAFT_751159 [Mycena epipterygia]|nr:hypothetical protein C8R44DRAFT_751159 [Mycena epipterygia]